MGLRLPELLIILVVLLLVFGANKIPQLGDALGKGIRNFKKSSEGPEDTVDVTPKDQAQLSEKAPTTSAASASTTARSDRRA